MESYRSILIRILVVVIYMMISQINYAIERIPIYINNSVEGAPMTLGIPFSQGALCSPDHVRVLDKNGHEIPSQTNLVNTWEPLDYSVKWLWVFFFSNGDEEYILEYGEGVYKASIKGDKIKIKNGQRQRQSSYVDTGPLKFTIGKNGNGFIDNVLLDLDRDGFDGKDTIAISNNDRGSFLDILDELGVDSSSATILRTVRERGSGPLHAILRLEGNYKYHRNDNRDSPFTIRIHLYAGKSYIRVFHTLTYTGIPDKHTPVPGEHANIALAANVKIRDESNSDDEGWWTPNDQIAGTGLSLLYNIEDDARYLTAFETGHWTEKKKCEILKSKLESGNTASVLQTGPKPDRIPPVPNSNMEEQIDGIRSKYKY